MDLTLKRNQDTLGRMSQVGMQMSNDENIIRLLIPDTQDKQSCNLS